MSSSFGVNFGGFTGQVMINGPMVPVLVTDAEGRFEFPIFPGPGQLQITVPSPWAGQAPTVVTTAVDGDTDLTIQMAAAPTMATVSGRVVDRDGAPVAGQSVCLGACSTTDSDGRYSFSVAAGQYTLSVSRYADVRDGFPTWYGLSGGSMTVSSDTVLDITLQNRFVRGQVVDADGKPVVGAWMQLGSPMSSSFGVNFGGFTGQVMINGPMVPVLVTDAEGRFEFPIFPGPGLLQMTVYPDSASGLGHFVVQDVPVVGDISLAVAVQFLDETAHSAAVPAGGSLSTDIEGDGATPADPVETKVTTPVAGEIRIEEGPITETPPPGFSFLTQQVNITAPLATVGDPIVITFQIDCSRLVGTCSAANVAVFRDGTLVPECTGTEDPCVSQREVIGNNVILTVRTSAASHWNLAAALPSDRDTTAPVFSNVPSTVTAFAISSAGALVDYPRPTAVDGVDGEVAVQCTPGPGTEFAINQTTVTCTARDGAGNQSTASFVVWVTYQAPTDSSFFQAPIRADGSSVFKIKRTVPVKFALTGVSAPLQNVVAHFYARKISDAASGTVVSESDPTVGEADLTFEYDPADGGYKYLWKTLGLSPGTYRLRVDLGDGVVHEVDASLR
jgi:hypothetical protein